MKMTTTNGRPLSSPAKQAGTLAAAGPLFPLQPWGVSDFRRLRSIFAAARRPGP